MVIVLRSTDKIYVHPQETWNVERCTRLARRKPTSPCGGAGPQGWLLNRELGHYVFGHFVRYNGGTVIDGEWWSGEEWPLPCLPKGFKIITKPTWGYFMVKVQ